MKFGKHLCVVAVLVLLECLYNCGGKKNQKGFDVSSILSFFGDSKEIGEPTEQPAFEQKKSRTKAKRTSDGKEKRCRCEERAARRLRREIKNISFKECEYQGTSIIIEFFGYFC